MKLSKMFKNRKGISLGDLQQVVLLFVITGIIAGVGVLITSQFEAGTKPSNPNDTSALSSASYVLNNTTTSIGNLVARLPLIGTIAGFVVLLGFVLTLLVRRAQGG